MKKVFILLFFPIALTTFAQTTEPKAEIETAVQKSENKPDKNGVYTLVDKMPEFFGGEEALLAFLDKNQKKPAAANGCGIIGTVIVRFVVTKLGTIRDIEITKTTHHRFNMEAIRLVKLLPTFIPGEQNGVKVDVYYTQPISIRLQ